jgi:Xaa-Pro dipeptidase
VTAGPYAEPYPRFSDAEMRRRHEALFAVMAEHDVEHVLAYGAERSGTSVGWLTRWPTTREAAVVLTPGHRDALLVGFHNHVPNAARIATEADVRSIGPQPMATVLEELRRRGGVPGRVGVIGPLGFRAYAHLVDAGVEVIELQSAYTRLRLRKSAEELDWLRVGCALTDAAVLALREGARPGMTERELADLVERAYVGRGGTTHIHYFAATPMAAPEMCAPAQWSSARRLQAGDALICEISAAFWGHPGQALRTFAVAAEPAPLYAALHDAADAAFDAILARLRPGATTQAIVDAAGVIEEAGFTTRDDLVHGFVGGYLPPVLGSRSRTLEPVSDFAFETGMTVVVQPNVVTHDERAGVQTGELVLIADDGARRLHDLPRGLLRIG